MIAPRQKNKIAFIAALIAGLLFPVLCSSQDAPRNQKYEELAEKIRSAGLRHEKAFKLLEALIKTAGPRLTGSPGAAAAVGFMRKHMQELGLEAWLEPVTVQHWVRGDIEEAKIIQARQMSPYPLSVTALGWSIATPAPGISAPVGLSVGGSPETFLKLQSLENLLKPSGIVWVRPGGGGADIGPLAGQGEPSS